LQLHKLLIEHGYNTTEKHHNFKCGKYWIDIPIRIDQTKIAIEYESKYYHQPRIRQDRIRTEYLINKGWKILVIRSSKKIPDIYDINHAINKLIMGSDKEILTLSDY